MIDLFTSQQDQPSSNYIHIIFTPWGVIHWVKGGKLEYSLKLSIVLEIKVIKEQDALLNLLYQTIVFREHDLIKDLNDPLFICTLVWGSSSLLKDTLSNTMQPSFMSVRGTTTEYEAEEM